MNLSQSLSLEALQAPVELKTKQRLTALEMADRVFQISAQSGNPYKNITAKQWAKKWLVSPEFVLTEIETDRIALMRTPRNTNQVLRNMAASKESLEPVVVDMNKQRLESSNGYRPSVVAVDGAHRAYGLYLQGRDTIMAWVGTKALPRVRVQPLIQASAIKTVEERPGTKVSTAAVLHAAQGIPAPPRQDAGDGGSSPTMTMPGVKSSVPSGSKYIKDRGVRAGGGGAGGAGGTGGAAGTGGGAATGSTGGPGGATSGPTLKISGGKKKSFSRLKDHGESEMDAARRTPEARSSGYLEQPDPSDTTVPPDPSDVGQSDDPSDRLQYKEEPQLMTPGTRKMGTNEKRGFQSPMSDSPGSGVGPRLDPDKGASQSEMQKRIKAKARMRKLRARRCTDCDMSAGPIKVKKMVTKKKRKK